MFWAKIQGVNRKRKDGSDPMKHSLYILRGLIISISLIVVACQPNSVIDPNSIVGVWEGEAQWLCENDDLVWSTTIEFKPDGSFTATMDIPASNAPLPHSLGNGTWSLSKNDIEIKFPTTIWTGVVSTEQKMEGTLSDEGISCTGKWLLTKQ